MSDKNNDMALGIAIGGGGGLCLFVLYNLFSSMSENREQLLLMRQRDIESELQTQLNEWQNETKKPDPDDPFFSIGGKRKLRKKSRKSKKSTAKMRWKKKRTRRLRRKRRKMRTRAK
jgi:hypothetical protein